jgi:hypothetical protein
VFGEASERKLIGWAEQSEVVVVEAESMHASGGSGPGESFGVSGPGDGLASSELAGGFGGLEI